MHRCMLGTPYKIIQIHTVNIFVGLILILRTLQLDLHRDSFLKVSLFLTFQLFLKFVG